jgi:isocitrate dehydrogenase (NAD+)
VQDAIGRDIANPTAMLLCSANMLAHLHMHSYARALRAAVERTLREEKVKTRDLGGFATTIEYAHEVIRNYQPPSSTSS